MGPEVNLLNVAASPLALNVQPNNSAMLGLQSAAASSLSLQPYAIRTDQTITINTGGDLDGNPLLPNDDALIYAAKGFTFNSVPILPVNRNTSGDPILDPLTGKQVLVDHAVSVAAGYTTINANNNPYIGLLPPQVVPNEIITIPTYSDTKTQELNARTPVGATTITFNASSNPINSVSDWNSKFPAPGTSTNPKVVRVTGGGLNIPNGVNLSNYIITVDSGDINFNGNSNIIDNVVLVTSNGNINLGKVQSNNLSVFSSGAINMNSLARFGGKTLIANNSNNITFNGATKTATNTDTLKVISQGNITFNAASDTRGDFLSTGTFTANGTAFIFGSINAKQNIIFNNGAYVTAVSNNSAPTNLSLSNSTTPENVAANSLIGTFASTDPDSGNTFTYSLVSGTGSTDNAAFTIINNELRIINSPDFEAKNSYSIRVRTTDQGGLSYEKTFTIGITDVNEAPTSLILSNSTTPENVAANSLIGTFASTDPDTTPQTFTYSLVTGTGSTDNASFAIINNELRIVSSPNFEAKNSYSIRVRTTDQGGLSYEKVFTVGITDINEVPTALVLSNNITPENVAANTLVGNFSSTDPDSGNTFTYSLVSGTGSTDNTSFTIVNNELRIASSPDFEAKNSYSIRVRTTDQGGLSYEKVFTIGITDVNEAPIALILSNNTTPENVAANSLIGTFASTDPDTTPQTFTYSLVAGTGSTDNGAFTIINNELRIVNSPDFETKNSYSIRVRTTDQGGLSYEKVFTVSITDVNEAPTALVLSNNTTPENVSTNSLIGTFASTDPDITPQTFTYSLVAGTGSTDNATFTIIDNDLRIINSPDFEAKNSYSIRVRTTDQGGLSFEQSFTVNITNVNEAPSLATIGNQTIAAGTSLSLSAIAIDPDTPTTLTYSLEPNAPTGASINPSTGIFTWTPTVAQAGSYTIGIRVTDDGNPNLSNTTTFQAIVTNSNLPPTDLVLSPTFIAENVPTNTEVGSFSSIDPDTGNTFTYSLVSGIGDINNNLFAIENDKLKLNFSPDFETQSSYSIRVKTTDQNGLSFEKALIISITDVNESPTALALSNNTTPENVAANSLIGTFSSTDPDITPQTFTYSLVAGTGSTDNAAFSIVNNELHIVNSPDFEAKSSYSIRVKTTDQGGLSYEKIFTINITNINEAPIFTSTPSYTGNAGQPFVYNITTTDPENDSRDITVANLPTWLTFVDNHDGTAQLIGTPNFTNSGVYNIQLKVKETNTFEHLEATQSFLIAEDISLREQSFFSPIRSIPIAIPSQPSILQFKIDGLNFDTTSSNSIHDAFEVSLVDSNGKPLTLTIGAGKNSFFNLSESSSTPALTSATTYNSSTGIVTLNLTGIPANTQASLVFRLINDDADTTTQVTIKDFSIVDAPANTAPAQQTVLPTRSTPAPLNLVNTVDVSSSILPQYDRTSFNQDSKLLYADLALKNSGTYAVNNPLLVAVTNISDPTVQVRNTNGLTPDGLPYYDFSALVANGKLDRGQTTALGNLVFYNPNQVQFTYTLQVLSTLNRSPVITSQPNSEVVGGKTYTYNLKANDPDSDTLTYKLLTNPDGMTINSQTGVITWATTVADIGNKSISVEVRDGRGGVSQQDYNLAVVNAPPNRPPAFVTNPVVQAYINKLYQYDSQAIDPDNDSLTYSVVIGPEGLKVDPNTGSVQWTAPPSLVLGDTAIGQINVPGQNQEFSFSGKAGEKLYFDPLQYSGARENWSFQVYSPSGQLVVNTDLHYYNNSLLTLNEDGNYRIVINPGADTVGAYGFSVINPSLLPITNFDTTINGTLNLGSQDNVYRFTASKGQKLYFDMLSRVYDKMDWVLYDPRNVAIAGSGYMDDMEVDIQADGEYILAIRGRDALTTSNNYSFSIINSPLPVTPMTLGTTINGNLKKGEQDTFTFTGTAGQQLFFDTLNTTNYFIAYIYDPSGVQIDSFDTRYDRSPDNASLRLTSNGTYKIKIDGPDENNGAYGFRLLDKAAATPITLDTQLSGTLGNSGYNTELFQFELTSRQYIYFDATYLGGNPGAWQLYDASGQLYYSQRLSQDNEGWLSAGKYTLAMQGYGTGYDPRYQFNLITPELTTKSAITFGTDVSGTLAEKGAQDYYTFAGTAGQQLFFDSLSNLPTNLTVIVYDPTGREVLRTDVRSDLNPSDYAALRLTMNGIYNVTVDGEGESTGDYKFRFLNKADSPLVALDTDIVGTFDNGDRGSVGYRFNIPTQTYVYIDGQLGDGTWSVYNASGQRVTTNSTNADQELWLGAGEYWLVIQGNGDVTYQDYKLRIVTPDLLYNNIALNTDIIGTIAEKGEQDYYGFEGKAGQILFYDDLGTTSSIYVTLYDPSGRNTGFQVSGQSDGNPNDFPGLRLTSDGTYLLSVDGIGETTGTYGFRLLNMADSPLVALNADITGTFDSNDRGSVGYRFNLSNRTYVYVDGQLGDGAWSVYDASGQRVAGNYYYSTSADQELWLNAGEYWLVAQGNGNANIDYKLKIITPDLLTAPLTFNADITGSISTKGEQDYYTFTGVAGQQLFFDALGSDPNISVYITDPFGRNVYNRDSLGDRGPDNNTGLILTKNGTYTVAVDGISEAIGNYKFRFLSTSSSPLINVGDLIQGTFDNGGVGSSGYRFKVTNTQNIHVDVQDGQSPNYWIIYGRDGQIVTRQDFPNSTDVTLTQGEYWLVAIGNSSSVANKNYKFQLDLLSTTPSTDLAPIPYIPNTVVSGSIADLIGGSIVSPILNSNSSSPYTVTSSGDDYGSHPPYYAFDGRLSGQGWWSSNPIINPYIQIDLGSSSRVSGYSFVSRADGEYNESPRQWVFTGSNDGINFTTLDSKTGQPVWGLAERRAYSLEDTANYRYYRWSYVTQLSMGQSVIAIQEIQLLNSNSSSDTKKIYSFDATAGQSFYFDSLSPSSGLQYSIVDPNGRLLVNRANVAPFDRGEIFAGETGTYQLIVDSATGIGGNFSFNLVPYSNTSTTPTPIALGSNISGTFGSGGQESKFYRFTANANQLLAIDPVAGDAGNYWIIYSPKGDTVTYGRLNQYNEVLLNQTGEYTLVFEGLGAANTYYQLNLLAPSTTTTPLTLGADISGSISTKGQSDTYTFTGKAGQQVFYDALGGNNYLPVKVFDPTGKEIINRADSRDDNFKDPFTNPSQNVFTLQIDGTYTLKIAGSIYDYRYNPPIVIPYTGNYKFRLLDKADATPVNVGDYITGTFDNGALGSKLYKLTITETKTLYFDGLQGDGIFHIYNRNGYEIAGLALNDSHDQKLTLEVGEYLIVMQGTGSLPNYQLKISQPPSYLTIPIAFDTVISDSITEKGAKRNYSFDGIAGKQLYFDGLGGDFDGGLAIYDPAGKKIFERYPQSDYPPNQGLILQMDGTYRVVIDSASHNNSDYGYVYPSLGNYKFRLLDKANATVVNVGDDITGTFDNGALGAKAYKLTLTETKLLYFDGLQGNGIFHLYSPDGEEITSLNVGDAYDRELTLGAGEYLIVMQGNGSDPNYKLHISEVIIPPTESIGFGTVVSGNITEKGVKRNYTFTGTAGHQLFFDNLGGDYNVVRIYDPVGRKIFEQDGRYDRDPYVDGLTLQMDGNYQVVIDSSAHNSSDYSYVYPNLGNYKFRLLDKALASESPLDTVISGTPDNGGLGTTEYRLKIDERKYVYFDAQSGSGNWIIYTPDGKTRVASGNLNGNLSQSKEFWLDPGEYTIAILGTNPVPYQFKVVTPDLITTAYKVGDTITGSISKKGEKDYYTFEGKPGQRLFFDGLSATANIFATLTSPTGKVIFNRLDTQSNFANEILDENGTYTLTIDGSSYDFYGTVFQGNYSLRLLEYASASSSAASQAVLVQTNTDITGSFSDVNGKQSNLYRFSASQGQTLYIDTIAGDASNFWGIYAPNGTTVTYGTLSGSGEFTIAQTGEYTLEVQGRGTSNRDYTLRLITPDSSIANYTLGNVVNSSLNRKGETDTYNFAGTIGQRLFFDAIASPSNLRARLYSPTDVLLKDSLLSAGDWLPETLAETGNYRLVIDGDGAAIGNYGFSLSDRAAAPTINLATPISGTVNPNSANLYKLNGIQGQILNFDLIGPTLAGATWAIYDPTGLAIATPDSASPDFKVTLPSTGLYSLIVNGNSGGDYSFQVTDITPVAVSNSGLGVVQSVNLPASQTINYVDYNFTGNAGTQIYYDAQAYGGADATTTNIYSRYRLINPDGSVALDNQSATLDNSFTLSQTGSYKLQAYSLYPSLQMNFSYQLLEMPSSLASPSLNYLALNDTVAGTLGSSETKIYTFQNSVGTKVLFNGMYGDGVTATLYDPSGRVVTTLSFNYNDSAPYTLTQEGLYHLAISAQAGNHSYSFQLLDASTAQEIEYNLPITAALDNGEKGIFYKIKTDANKILYFDNLSFNTNWQYPWEYQWKLFDSGNNLIASKELYSDFEAKIDKAGEYYLYVAGLYATNRVDYKFRVVSTDANSRRDVLIPGTGTSGVKNDDGSLATVSVELQAKDGKGGSAIQDYDIKLFADPDNANPVILSTPDTKYSLAEDGYRYQVRALDPNSDTLTYRLVNSPVGAVINRDTGELLWFPSSTVAAGSKATFTVEVLDGRGGKDRQTFTVDIYGNLGKIQGAVFDDLNGNGLLDSKLIKGDNPAVVLAIDVSGSTAAPFYGTGKLKDVKTVLDAEVAAIKALVNSIVAQGQGTKLKIAFLPFTSGATIQDMDLVLAGLQEYTTALADSNNNGISNITEVLSLPIYHVPIGGSVLNNVISQIDTLSSILPGTPNLIFLSDGYFRNLDPIEISAVVADIKSRGGNVTAFGIGEAATTETLKPIDPDVIKLVNINELSDIFTGFDDRYALEPFKENVNVYLDLNNDGQYQANEPTQLTKRGEAPNSFGKTPYYYTFDHLTPGNYTVRILTPNGYSLTNPDTGFVTDTITTAGETFSHLFGVTKVTLPANTAPQFTTIPPTITQLKAGDLLKYNAKALDPDADPINYSLVLAPKGMTVDATTGTVIWNPTKTEIADYYAQLEADRIRVGPSRASAIPTTPIFDVLLRAQDGKGGQALQYIKVELLQDNNPPVFTTIFPTTSPQVNKTFQYQAKALDPNNDTVVFSLVTAPSGASINASTGLLTWTPNQIGDNNFTIKASDGKGGETFQTGKLSVINAIPNHLPVISSTPRNSARYGNSYNYEIIASDADGDALTYSLIAAPAGMTIKDNLITWVPKGTQFGDNNVSIQVTDAQGGISTQTFKVRVGSQAENHIPTISSAPNLVTTVDREYQYDLSGSDSDGDRLLWSLDQAPTGMAIDATTGKLRWQPTTSQIGDQTIAIRLSDNYGAYSVQEYTLKVNAINSAPNIVSTPITQAGKGQPYTYNVIASDAENDTIRYSLISHPDGMAIDQNTGKITWTPNVVGNYEIKIQATDSQGKFNTQTYKLEVGTTPINHAPTITSTPKFLADTNSPYNYQVTATDPDAGDHLRYELIDNGGASGLTVNANTGLVSWNSPNSGIYKVVIGAVDDGGLGAAQGFTLTARPNQLPVISSDAPPTTATPDIPYIYDLRATDPDGGSLKYSLDQTSKDLGISIDDLGRVRWTPTSSQIGNHPVTISITDESGGIITQNFTINVQADTVAPNVKLAYSGTIPAEKGSTIAFQVQASDDIKIADLQLLVNGNPVILDPNGTATVTFNTLGNNTVIARAIDSAGNIGQATTVIIPVIDPTSAQAPEVSFELFGNDHTIRSLSELKGLVDDPDDNLQSYAIAIARMGTEDWETILVGSSEVSAGGVLGKLDPSTLSDDSYRIRLTATDTTGLSNSVEDQIEIVSGGLKLGNFTLSFTDLSIPIAGIPINVTRTYDSLNAKTSDDFGYGWRLEFRDTDLRTSLPRDTVYEETGLRTQAFKDGTKVFITLPGGKRETFTFNPTRDRLSAFFPSVDGYDTAIYHPSFTAEKGVTDTLTVVDTRLSNVNGKYYSLGSGVAYNPADEYFGNKYILTTKEGIVYEIDGTTGDLNSVTNPNGNKLTFSDSGITSDTGKSVTFQRDASGRITSVTDPAGQVVKYQYDAKGDLIGVSDRESNTTQFKYAQPTRDHFLTEIVDPLGRSGVKNEYDEQGRLVKLVDALGKPVQLAYDPTNSTQTVTDALGNPTTYVYDTRGNVVTEVDAKGGIITRTYDDDNNLLKKVDADGVTATYTYDSNGNPLTLTDGNGNTTRIQYNRYSEILNVISPTGLNVTSTYDDRGNLLSRTNTDGQTIRFDYDAFGRLTQQTAPDGEVSTFDYDRFGNAIGFTDSRGNKTNATYDLNGKVIALNMVFPTENQTLNISYTYDKAGRITSVTDPQGNVSRTEYDANGNITATIDIQGNRTEYFYDEKGQQTKVILPDNTPNNPNDNPVVLAEYDAAGRVISQTSATGLKTRYTYDALGQLTDTIFADLTPNDPNDNPREQVEYTAAGRIKATVDIFGNRTEYTYDNLGRINQERDFFGNPLGNTTSYTYNTGGQVTSITDAKNRTTQIGLDDKGRASTYTYFDGTTSQVTYDALGRTQTSTNQLGQTTSYQYDAFGKVATVTNALNQSTQFTYNSRGSLVKVTDALGHDTQYEYDQFNRQIAIVDASGNRTETSYDQFGQVIQIKDANLHSTNYTYDNLGELTSVKLANQATTKYSYDNLGRLTQVEDANTNKTTYEYDAFNRKVATNLALGQRSTTVFNNLGQVANTTDFNGNVITYGYDQYGRLSNKSFSDPRVATVGYTYDPITSQVKTVTDGRGVTTYGFDSYDRVNLVTNPDGQTVGYTYDVLGNLKVLSTSANTVNYAYDKLNRLDTVMSGSQQLAKYGYDAVGNLVSTALADGTTETDSYDASNRLIGMNTRNSVGTVLSSYDYTLDGVGNRTKVIENGGRTVNYTFDAVNQLTQESISDPILGSRNISYEYDLVGNRLKRNDSDPAGGVTTYLYDANNRLKSATNGSKVTSFTYDNNGSTLTKSDGTSTVAYDWINDGENRLIGVASTNAGVTSQSSYVYDASGNRVASITDGVRKNFLLDPRGNARVLQESDANGQVLTKYTFGLGLIKSESGGNTSFYHSDGLGSTRLLTDASGQVTDRYTYDAFGRLLVRGGSSSNSFQFAGEQRDGTGLDYLRARYYDSDLGRFISKDAFGGGVGSPISQNPYAYANNNPINNTDPSGYETIAETAADIAIIGVLAAITIDSIHTSIEFNRRVFRLDGDPSRYINNRINNGLINPFVDRPVTPNPIPFPFPSPSDILPPILGFPKPEQEKQKPLVTPNGATPGLDGKNPGTYPSPGNGGAFNPNDINKGGGDILKLPPFLASSDDPYKRPSGFRKGVRDKVWENNKDADGNVLAPNGEVMDPNESWDMGHKPGYEFRKHQESAEDRGISRKQFLDEHNDAEHYRPEPPSYNRGHQGEDLTDTYLGP